MAKAQDTSWHDMLDSSNSSADVTIPKILVEDCDKSYKVSKVELQIAFNDSENEKKFDKLVNEKKIKSPFKRQMSNEKLADDSSIQEIYKKVKMESENSKKRTRKDSSESSSTGSISWYPREHETDQEVLSRRQKQIDYGKNTIGYDSYIATIPKDKRTREDPKTPPKHLKFSRRAWEGLVKSWRKKLHQFDPDCKKEEAE